ncbi:hypothetical protein [Paraglaciecola sp.]|uniref:hypothetical protein n=1 Tax=Paraglaciecola sp. TaxID=1920173 RepID=UPI0030F420D0
MKLNQLILIPVLLMVGCTSSDGGSTKTDTTLPANDVLIGDNLAIPDNSGKNEYSILFFGNSHIDGLSTILASLIKKGLPATSITVHEASSQHYLVDRLSDGTSLDILQKDSWSHVILQAQKYSQSGVVNYPTVGAQRWTQLAKQQHATPILFPEHPQRGKLLEGQRVYDLHQSIAAKQSACVAPIGPVWDRVLTLRPELVLHHGDGNHASNLGKFLSALVFYQIVSGNSADLLPYIDSLQVNAEIQDFLGQVVSQVLAEHPGCQYQSI